MSQSGLADRSSQQYGGTEAAPPIGGAFKRLFDVSAALAGIVVLSPLFVMLVLLVKFSDGGSVIYGHRRIGRNGKMFRCFKFRTMVENGEDVLAAHFARNPHEREEWAATRKQFGQAIGKFQGTSFKLADMAAEIEAAEMLVLKTAWKADQGSAADEDFAMAKLYATEMLARATDNALQIFGGMGLMPDLPLERLWRDARVERIWDGTSEIQRHIISRALLRPHEG